MPARPKCVRLNTLVGAALNGKLEILSDSPKILGPAWAVLKRAGLIEGDQLNLQGLLDFLSSDPAKIELLGKSLKLRKDDKAPGPTKEEKLSGEARLLHLNSQIGAIIGRIAAADIFASKYGLAHEIAIDALKALGRGDIPEFNQCQHELEMADQHLALNLPPLDLGGLNLRRMCLSGVEFKRVDLAGADLSASNLNGARITMSPMSRSILIGSDFESAVLENVDLTGANLRGASFCRAAVLREVDLSGAQLDGVNFRSTIFVGITYLAGGRTVKTYDPQEIKHSLERAGAIV
ncbi:MAG: pentapeptide repeat-containing protein [Candidatus Margulisbacteria bacterium]|nr:pentapeptide repeat-containing protein [Candidatus Margulisiibacteriota bacterium]